MTTHDRISWRSMVKLTTVADVATAHVLAAHLDHEGIDCHIRSESLGPYPIAIGSWGETQIWVDESDLEDAREVLAAIDSEAQATEVDRAGVGKSPNIGRSLGWWLVAAALLAWIIYLRIASVL